MRSLSLIDEFARLWVWDLKCYFRLREIPFIGFDFLEVGCGDDRVDFEPSREFEFISEFVDFLDDWEWSKSFVGVRSIQFVGPAAAAALEKHIGLRFHICGCIFSRLSQPGLN
jgi:hypothetical protein